MSKKTNEIKLGKRGYKAVVKNKKFNFGDGKHIYEVIELSGPKMDNLPFGFGHLELVGLHHRIHLALLLCSSTPQASS